MAENTAFARESIYPSYFANRIQDFLSAARTDLRVSLKSSTDIQIVPDDELGLAAIAIEGRWRWVEETISRSHPGGAKGTYSVWAVATDNDVDNTPKPFSDHTDYDFDLRITNGIDPSGTGVVIFEKIAEIDWSGTEIEAIRQSHGSVTGAMLEDGALPSKSASDVEWTRQPGGGYLLQLKANSVGASELADNSVDTAALIALAVTEAKIAAEAITAGKLAPGSVTATKIAELAVQTAAIAAKAVIEGKIGDEAVNTTQLKNLAVTAAKLAANAVETGKIANLAVTAAKLAEACVETAKLADGAVTEVKIADAAATSRKTKLTAGKIAASEGLALGEAYGDIPGCKLEITPLVASNLLIIATFDFTNSSEGIGVAENVGSISVDGAAENASIARQRGVFNGWASVSQSYVIPLTAALHTIKLRAKRASGTVASEAAKAGTGFSYVLLAS